MEQTLEALKQRVESTLETRLHAATVTGRLRDAMAYALLGGGKRIRPVLVYAAGQALGSPLARLDAAACAVECIHAYSLIHDDLPAMDDDDLRRGRPTCHRAFDEASAILAGDALQTLAFEILADNAAGPEGALQALEMIGLLARASGARGMVLGQAIDLEAVGKHPDIQQLETMHRYKTGALIEAAVTLGAIASGRGDNNARQQLGRYAAAIGLAFQIRDDILDVEATTEQLGKPQGSDQSRDKPTYASLLGLDGARDLAQSLHEQALAALHPFGENATLLAWISHYIIDRTR